MKYQFVDEQQFKKMWLSGCDVRRLRVVPGHDLFPFGLGPQTYAPPLKTTRVSRLTEGRTTPEGQREGQHSGHTVRVPLTKGAWATVDAADLHLLGGYRWHLQSAGYAARTGFRGGRKVMVLMHRVILAAPAGVMVDHRDADRLNNTRGNLRLATPAQNSLPHRKFKGASLYKGVSWMASVGRWRAEVNHEGWSVYLGTFASQEDAARAYDEVADRLHGEYAKLNFPRPAA